MNIRTQSSVSPRPRNIWIASGVLALVVGMLTTPAAIAGKLQAAGLQTKKQPSLSEQVRERLVTLPWFNVFDNLEYRIQGDTVTLSGQVLFPLTKSAVGQSLQDLPGVKHIVNNVEELPNTPLDNQLRWAMYRAIFYKHSPLFHYSMGPNPPIHIIVSNGRVKLVGVVINKMDRQIAEMRARSVPGVISVKNELRVQP